MHASDAESGGDPLSFRFKLDKIEGQGEDAVPLLWVDDKDGTALLAVFDGMGGAGGQMYQVDGEARSGAYLAAHSAQLATDDWFRLEGDREPDRGGSLRDKLVESLKERVATLGATPQSRIRSKMIRLLPTTAAVALLEPTKDHLLCEALWAGDSRIYVLDPEDGLGQLTVDHLRERADAQENLRMDSPMSKCVSASDPFELDSNIRSLRPQSVVVAATDGCFGYVDSPAMFEYLLLATLREAHDMPSWKALLRDEIRTIAADDASMALVAAGWSHFDDLRLAFTLRTKWLEHKVEPIVDARRSRTLRRRELVVERARAEVATVARHLDKIKSQERLQRAQLDAAKAATSLAMAAHELARARYELEVGRARATDGTAPGDPERQYDGRLDTTVAERATAVVAATKAHDQTLERVAEMVRALDEPGPAAPEHGDDRAEIAEADTAVRRAAELVWDTYRLDYERWLPRETVDDEPEGVR